ncbi:MAG: type II toxin-antitoxin system prevent-host-death family antitoxin [Verrucomicrobiota bacterium]
MKAKIIDLRYRTKDVLASLERGEPVEITSHGKLKGVIEPVKPAAQQQAMRVQDHPMFGSLPDEETVEAKIDQLRGTRYS